MNSKERRRIRRRGLISQLEKIIKKRKVDMTGVKSVEEMNDFCPHMYEKCGHPKQEYNFDCYGKYKMCKYYQRLSQ